MTKDLLANYLSKRVVQLLDNYAFKQAILNLIYGTVGGMGFATTSSTTTTTTSAKFHKQLTFKYMFTAIALILLIVVIFLIINAPSKLACNILLILAVALALFGLLYTGNGIRIH